MAASRPDPEAKTKPRKVFIMLQTLTFVHVVISLAGIGSGFVVMFGLLKGKRLDGWTAVFLATTVATSVTGFFFPFEGFKPSHVVGILSLIVLGLAIPARYSYDLAGAWRSIVVSALMAQYFNVFVLVVQSFQKVPELKAAAPTQREAPFKITQLAVLAAFIVLGALAVIRFRV